MASEFDDIAFSQAWVAAWNAHDVDAVLRHFHDEVIFTSPVAVHIGFAPDGVVKGKDALRSYWLEALRRNPGLHFDLTACWRGVNTVVIGYRNQLGHDRVEVLTFLGALVIEGHGLFGRPLAVSEGVER
ncbi:nuclear transport factor 2 family protein [Sphingomonas profundi]|uniref:nuclear transport factor 2 family protein n=1 Tax=Alterirhizorhabdus profundi TaxID=2681549 RepID=UPI0012E7F2B8|nr:nuclear transport factor 2 family protein [Sphingomonas profundi]